MAGKTYNLKKVFCTFGPDIITGFAEGDAIVIEYDEDQWELVMGADGEGCRSKTNNYAATVTLRLLQSSDSNDKLQDAWDADRIADNGLRPLFVKDGSGRSQFLGERTWIQKGAPATFARAAGAREWVMRTDELIQQVRGNNL